jgi:phosphatidylglycerol:prolipoprotein diacylglycerol transferase
MYNDILTFGGVTIHGYGLMIGLGFLCALFVAEYRAKKRGLSTDQVFSIFLLILIFGFIGAKLLFCLVEIKAILRDPMLILSGDGFVIYGGIIGGIAAVMLYCRIKKASFLTYLDLLVPSVALAQGFGRIGCFLAGCCYGRETDSAFCIVFQNSLYAPNGIRLLPTQLMMSAGNFLIALVLLLYARKDRKNGRTGGLYLILYSVGRFVIEFFRNDYRGSVGFLSTSQFISIFTLILGILLFATKIFNKGKPKEAVIEEETDIPQD